MCRSAVLAAFVIATFIVTPLPASADGAALGVVAGGVLPYVSTSSPDLESETTVRWLAGLSFSRPSSRRLGAGLDIFYARKGLKTELAEYWLDYIVICPRVRIGIKPGTYSPYLTLGGELGVLARAEVDLQPRTRGQQRTERVDIKDAFRRTDVCLSVGIGADLTGLNQAAFIEVRYSLGLTNVADTGNAEWKTRAFYLMLGVHF